MKIIETYSGSRYMLDETNKTFKRMPGADANLIHNDEQDQSYVQIISLQKDYPMQILWMLDGKEKTRLTTPVKSINEYDNED